MAATDPRAVLLLAIFSCGVLAAPAFASAHTHGGAVAAGRVIHVTTLADSGPGSLREATHEKGPRVIVFDVAGTIHLASDLKVSVPDVTIAGQSAPAPGITLTGGALRLRANDIVLQHIAVRPGPASSSKVNGNRDSITIGGGNHPVHDIRVGNVSASWSVDENVDIAGNTRDITVRNSIIAEALNRAGHPKGRHSMGMLINKNNQNVTVAGNLFVSNMFRNPAIARGSSVVVAYNEIVNPGENAIQFYAAAAPTALRATVIHNVIAPGPDTSANVTAVQIPDDMQKEVPDAQIYLTANQAPAGPLTNRGGFKLATAPPLVPGEEAPRPEDVRSYVMRFAGAHPATRDPQDRRILDGVAHGTSRIVDNLSETGGLKQTEVHAPAKVPGRPFAMSRLAGLLRIEAWLCETHLEAGGPPTPQCALPVTAYRRALHPEFSQGNAP